MKLFKLFIKFHNNNNKESNSKVILVESYWKVDFSLTD